MSTLVRITVAQDVSSLVDLKPGESPWSVIVYNLGEGEWRTPDALEEWALKWTERLEGPTYSYHAGDTRVRFVPKKDRFVEPEYIVMAHFSEDL